MVDPELLRDVATLLEQCAQRRAGMLGASTPDARTMQAEVAGRELMAALVRAVPFADLSVAATLRRLLGYVYTVVGASTPDDAPVPQITVSVRAIRVPRATAVLLYTVVLALILAALDDDATELDVRLVPDALADVRVEVECDRSGVLADAPVLERLRAAVAQAGGTWQAQAAPHGRSWLITLTVPQAADMRQTEVAHGR